MKVCIIFQGSYVHLLHAMAIELREKYGITEFCGYVYTEYSYDVLLRQKDIVYTNLLADHRVHLDMPKEKIDWEYLRILEKKYGIPNLWPYVYIDREIMNSIPPKEYNGKYIDLPFRDTDNLYRILQNRFRAVETFLTQEKPDYVISWTIGCSAQLMLIHVARAMGIPVMNGELVRTGHRLTMTHDYNTFTEVNKTFAELRSGGRVSSLIPQAQSFLAEFNKTKELKLEFVNTIDAYERVSFLSPRRLYLALRYFVLFCMDYAKRPKYFEPSYASTDPYHFLKHKIALKLRTLRGYKDLCTVPQRGQEYVFFPLHCEPEVSLLTIAPFFTDQLCLIRQIARSLPIHMMLYVKEHPAMINYRQRSYYKQLLEIPNVRLIHPKISSASLIQGSRLNVVITSTVGWEATLQRKPVISFGNIFYNTLSFVKKCEKITDLPYLIQQQLEHFAFNEGELEQFLAAIFEQSVPMDMFRLWHVSDIQKIRSDEGFINFVRLTADIMRRSV